MASNGFGTIFRITTWGESHGNAIGVVIDGCPAGVLLEDEDINRALRLRAPGRNAYTSPRGEQDHAEILSGIFEGVTTGAPISIIIWNKDKDSSKYTPIKDMLRPGHANYTYLEKYGIFDYRGGGRSSARETACRVAAGAVAKKCLEKTGIAIVAYIDEIGDIKAHIETNDIQLLQEKTHADPLFCPDPVTSACMAKIITEAKEKGDSVGGVVRCTVIGLPSGFGDPVYEKIEANLAKALMSIPASKGFEIGSGFQAVKMPGSEHNDRFIIEEGKVRTETNYAGGTLGGITTGMPLEMRVAFKPTSSIMQSQKTVSTDDTEAVFILPEGSRHDPCVAIRAVPVVEAMVALVLIDALLLNRSSRL